MRATSDPKTPLAPQEAARKFIEKIQKSSRILVAISGGSDSTGLLLALHIALNASGRKDIHLEAVTVDHALRAESAAEATEVAALCSTLDIPHHVRRWDDDKPKAGISAAARLARYRLIASVADEISADMVAVGHTLGDQLETIAMRTSRSTRQDNLGLAGMADAVLYDARLWVVRPFLNVRRQDIRNFLEEHGRGWIDDPSNEDVKYERIRVRQVVGLSDIRSATERADLSHRAAELIQSHAKSFTGLIVQLDIPALKAEMPVLRHALSALAAVIGGRAFGPAAETMDRLIALLHAGDLARMTAGRVVFDRRKDALYVVRENRNIETRHLKAGELAVWDDRFEITNGSGEEISVVPGAICAIPDMSTFPPSLPAGVVKRARQARPFVQRGGEISDAFMTEGVSIQPVLKPYDLFLTRFDLELANAIASLIRGAPYPQPPV